MGEAVPRIAAERGGAQTANLWVSWNGDTQAARWLVLGAAASGALTPLGSYRRTAFETAIKIEGLPRRLAVRGLGARGHPLGASTTLEL